MKDGKEKNNIQADIGLRKNSKLKKSNYTNLCAFSAFTQEPRTILSAYIKIRRKFKKLKFQKEKNQNVNHFCFV
jgi:hypothetical protein